MWSSSAMMNFCNYIIWKCENGSRHQAANSVWVTRYHQKQELIGGAPAAFLSPRASWIWTSSFLAFGSLWAILINSFRNHLLLGNTYRKSWFAISLAQIILYKDLQRIKMNPHLRGSLRPEACHCCRLNVHGFPLSRANPQIPTWSPKGVFAILALFTMKRWYLSLTDHHRPSLTTLGSSNPIVQTSLGLGRSLGLYFDWLTPSKAPCHQVSPTCSPSGGQPITLHVAKPFGSRIQVSETRVAVDDGTVTLQAGLAQAEKGLDLIEISWLRWGAARSPSSVGDKSIQLTPGLKVLL